MKFVYTMVFAVGIAAAQEKVTVPLTNPSEPAIVRANVMFGSIIVTAGAAGGQVIVESRGGKDKDAEKPAPPGMHRIDSGPGLNIEEDHNTVSIKSSRFVPGPDLVIQVPTNTSLKLWALNGGQVSVTGVNGDLEVQNVNGGVVLKSVSGSVVAHAMNGPITVVLDRVTPDKPMSFTSLNGKIDVTLPADTKARLRLKSDNGSIYSDFEVKTDAGAKPAVEDSRDKNGKYRIRMEKGVSGSINGGGPEFLFQTMNGDILIHKK